MSDLPRVLTMPHGGERNLALRAALELVEGEIGLVDQHGQIQCVVDDRERAGQLRGRLHTELRVYGDSSLSRRPDGRWLVWGNLPR
jgi:hypothetical protein